MTVHKVGAKDRLGPPRVVSRVTLESLLEYFREPKQASRVKAKWMDCPQFLEQGPEALEHQRTCHSCADNLDVIRRLRGAMDALPSAEPSDLVWARLRRAAERESRLRRWTIPVAIAAAILLTTFSFGLLWMSRPEGASFQPGVAYVEGCPALNVGDLVAVGKPVDVAGYAEVVLPGLGLLRAAEAQLTLESRQLSLRRGGIFLEVNGPMTVKTGDCRVEVLGTKFGLYRNGFSTARTLVFVVEGRIRIVRPSGTEELVGPSFAWVGEGNSHPEPDSFQNVVSQHTAWLAHRIAPNASLQADLMRTSPDVRFRLRLLVDGWTPLRLSQFPGANHYLFARITGPKGPSFNADLSGSLDGVDSNSSSRVREVTASLPRHAFPGPGRYEIRPFFLARPGETKDWRRRELHLALEAEAPLVVEVTE